jgi:hypothetical protein
MPTPGLGLIIPSQIKPGKVGVDRLLKSLHFDNQF